MPIDRFQRVTVHFGQELTGHELQFIAETANGVVLRWCGGPRDSMQVVFYPWHRISRLSFNMYFDDEELSELHAS